MPKPSNPILAVAYQTAQDEYLQNRDKFHAAVTNGDQTAIEQLRESMLEKARTAAWAESRKTDNALMDLVNEVIRKAAVTGSVDAEPLPN